MKIIFPILFLLISISSMSQNEFLKVSLEGVDKLKLGMTVSEVEKISGQTLPLMKFAKVFGVDTAIIKYKGAELTVIFMLADKILKPENILLYSIIAKGDLIRTISGIGVGDDVCKIVNIYEKYSMTFGPSYEQDNSMSKTKSFVSIYNSEKELIFNMVNKKVDSMTISISDLEE